MSWSDILPLLGVLIGGALTLLGTVITAVMTARREDRQRRREVRERERERVRETVVELLAKSAHRRRHLGALLDQPDDPELIAAALTLQSELETLQFSLVVSGHEQIAKLSGDVVANHKHVLGGPRSTLLGGYISSVLKSETELAHAAHNYMLGGEADPS